MEKRFALQGTVTIVEGLNNRPEPRDANGT
jgi:hypothetical protein